MLNTYSKYSIPVINTRISQTGVRHLMTTYLYEVTFYSDDSELLRTEIKSFFHFKKNN